MPRRRERGGPDWDRVARQAVNDFEDVVPDEHPLVARALAAIRATEPRIGLLSGSGSAVFGIYRRAGEAATAREALEAEGYRVVETRTLTRVPDPEPRVPKRG